MIVSIFSIQNLRNVDRVLPESYICLLIIMNLYAAFYILQSSFTCTSLKEVYKIVVFLKNTLSRVTVCVKRRQWLQRASVCSDGPSISSCREL